MLNPIEPVGQTPRPGSITNAQPGNIGMLAEVGGIPCTGTQTSIASSPQDRDGPGRRNPDRRNPPLGKPVPSGYTGD